MNKTQAAAVLALGMALGVGGKQAAEGLLSPAEAKVLAPVAHAVDLRRAHDGSQFSIAVYGTRGSADAGYTDLGQAKRCKPNDVQLKKLVDCMDIAANACEWGAP